jgi:hypothetical protein
MNNGMALDSLGYGQIANIDAAVAVSTALAGGIPKGTESIWIQAETQNARYRDDGTAPTAAVGMRLLTGSIYQISVAQAASMQVIGEVAGGKLNVTFYGRRSM